MNGRNYLMKEEVQDGLQKKIKKKKKEKLN